MRKIRKTIIQIKRERERERDRQTGTESEREVEKIGGPVFHMEINP